MAFALVNSVSVAPGNPGGTTAPIDTTGADLLVWSIGWWAGGGTLATPTDSKGNTWIPLTARGPGQFATHRFFYAKNPIVGPGHTFTAAGAGTFAAQILYAFSGAHAIPFHVESGASTGGAASLASGLVTPIYNDCLVIAGYACMTNPGNSAEVVSPVMSQIAVGSSPTGRTVAGFIIQTTATPINPTWSWTGSAGVAVSTAVFIPATTVSTTPIRISQEVIETVTQSPNPVVRVTQDAVEVITALAQPTARVTQYVVEVITGAGGIIPPTDAETVQFQIMMP